MFSLSCFNLVLIVQYISSGPRYISHILALAFTLVLCYCAIYIFWTQIYITYSCTYDLANLALTLVFISCLISCLISWSYLFVFLLLPRSYVSLCRNMVSFLSSDRKIIKSKFIGYGSIPNRSYCIGVLLHSLATSIALLLCNISLGPGYIRSHILVSCG